MEGYRTAGKLSNNEVDLVFEGKLDQGVGLWFWSEGSCLTLGVPVGRIPRSGVEFRKSWWNVCMCVCVHAWFSGSRAAVD